MEEQGGTESGQRDALRTAQREIDGVREIMTENIERVLERGERIDLLVDQTDRLGSSARDFRVRSRGLKRRMWWKNVKLMVLLALVVVFLVYLFVGFGCGLPGMFVFFPPSMPNVCKMRLLLTSPCSLGPLSPSLDSHIYTLSGLFQLPYHNITLSTSHPPPQQQPKATPKDTTGKTDLLKTVLAFLVSFPLQPSRPTSPFSNHSRRRSNTFLYKIPILHTST